MGKAGEKEKQTKKSSTVRETAKKNSMGKAKIAAGFGCRGADCSDVYLASIDL